jgi:acyl transferase domain-containing protein
MKTEANTMDPQQRLLLQATHGALTGAALAPVSSRNVGAFVGIAATDYESLSHRNGIPIGPFSFTAASPSVASGRIAYCFGMKGPAVSVDTACSASLVAAHMACSAFREGPMEAAVAAGVLLCLVPESTAMLHKATMLSPEGRSKTLDASADGYVRGEACRTLALAPLPASKGEYSADATTVESWPLGIILGSAVNTNGRASTLTAPNGPAQQLLLRQALAIAGSRPVDVDGVQMHSNGTALGDPIEVGGISVVILVSISNTEAVLSAAIHAAEIAMLVCNVLIYLFHCQKQIRAGGPASQLAPPVCHRQGPHRPSGVSCRGCRPH